MENKWITTLRDASTHRKWIKLSEEEEKNLHFIVYFD